MDFNNVITFIAVAILLVISPGPNGFLIAKTVPLLGKKAGFANIAGFVGAFYIHGALSIFGISILLVQSATAYMIFKLLGAAYLIWIGVKAIRNAIKPTSALSQQHKEPEQVKAPTYRSMQVAFWEGFLTNMLNPKVSMFYLAAFPQFMSADQSAMSAFVLVSAHSILNVAWFSLMVFALSSAKTLANSDKFKQWLNSVTGAVFIGFGAKLALSKSSL